jgi:2,4-dichlorophenol 6-monooxygenase
VLIFYFMNPDGNGMWAGGGLVKTGPERWDRHSESWVFMRELGPDEPDEIDETNVVERMRELLRIPDFNPEIRKIGRWEVQGVAAERYREGRVFLAGDAAHRHPPVSALGLNTAFGDTHNLAWKLALVLQGKADESLLDTYGSERQPVGFRVAEWALNGFKLRSLIDTAIGLKAGDREGNRRAFESLYADTPGGATSRAILAEVMNIQRIGPQAHDMEIGYRYESGALVSDGTTAPPRDPMAGIYQPITRPGSRLPHALLERDGQPCSTHDLVAPGQFVLFCANPDWVAATRSAAAATGLPVRAVLVDAPLPAGTPADSAIACQDRRGDWSRLREVGVDGAVLVRPDTHVAWRVQARPGDPAAALLAALHQALHLRAGA